MFANSSRNQKGEYIYRNQADHFFVPPAPVAYVRPLYPWEQGKVGNQSKITKEFFCCKGCSLNPIRTFQEKEKVMRYVDCGGLTKHSLPLRDGKEFIYPILIDLLNFIQASTDKRVIITSGHRCPEHNNYVDPSSKNQYSKHLIGAEVSFYVQGLENSPELIVDLIQKYFSHKSKYAGKKEYVEFKRYEKEDTDVAMPPWYNKEVFVKIYKSEEGRNFDNLHPYPYLSIQVRYDYDSEEKVTYSWDKAFRNFLRY